MTLCTQEPYEREYSDPRFKETDDRIRTEHRRMLMALETIHRISGDMLDKEKRAGPTGD